MVDSLKNHRLLTEQLMPLVMEIMLGNKIQWFFARNFLMHLKWEHYEKCLLMNPYHTSF